MVRPDQCPKWSDCSASMCPLRDPSELKELRGHLAGDDEVCRHRAMRGDPMVETIAKLEAVGASGLFTYQMIESIERVTPGIEGLALTDAYGAGPYRKSLQWIKNRRTRSKSRTPRKVPRKALLTPTECVSQS